jgi:hypothetical protein
MPLNLAAGIARLSNFVLFWATPKYDKNRTKLKAKYLIFCILGEINTKIKR